LKIRPAVVVLMLALPASPVLANRLHTVGFETNNISSTSTTELSTITTGTPTIVTSPVHSGTYSVEINPSASSESAKISLTGRTLGTIWLHFYVYFTALPPSTTAEIFASWDGGLSAENWRIELTSAGALSLYNDPTATRINATTTIQTGQWYEIGVEHVISNTAGSLELQVDCQSEGTPLTSVDTLATNVGAWNIGQWGTFTAYYDDIVTNDQNSAQGSKFATWPACPDNLYMLKPASDNSVTWAKNGANCSGTTNTDCVDDEPGTPDDASGYVSTSTNGAEDRLNSTTFSGGPDSDDTIISLVEVARFGGSSASGTNTGRLLFWDETGSQGVGTSGPVCDINGWTASHNPIATNGTHFVFDPGSRHKADIEAFDWGYEPVQVSGSCRVTSLWVMVEWASYEAAGCTAGLNLPLLGVGGCP